MAVFSVNGTERSIAVGGVFGLRKEIKLVSLQQGDRGVWTAVVQVGDDQPLDAPVGDVLIVQ